jgi:hypothetical protein
MVAVDICNAKRLQQTELKSLPGLKIGRTRCSRPYAGGSTYPRRPFRGR